MPIINILGHEYQWVRGSTVVGTGELGNAEITKGVITTDETLLPSMDVYILLHEVLHVLIFMGHLQFLKDEDGMDDEAKIDAVSSLLAHVLQSSGMLDETYFKREDSDESQTTVCLGGDLRSTGSDGHYTG